MSFKFIHLIVGLLSLGLFLFTGFYMKSVFPGAWETNEIIRFQYRANHIYILMIGLINVLAAVLPAQAGKNWRSKVAVFGSLLVLLTPILLTAAFFIEPAKAIPQRPLTLIGVILAGAGVVSIFISHLRKETFAGGFSRD